MRESIYKQVSKNRYLLAGILSLLFITVGGYAIYNAASSYAAIATVDKQVVASSDDAYHTQAGWPDYSHVDGVVYAGAPGSAGATVGGWRWTGLNIPAGATITNAYVELNQEGYGFDLTSTLALEKSASPATFSSGSSPSSRWGNKTTFQISWAWAKSNPNAWIKTPSLAAGIQELVDSYGAVDSIVLLENGTGVTAGQYHSWKSYDSNSVFAAKFHVEYSTGGTVSSPTPTPSSTTIQATPTPVQATPTPAQTSVAPTPSVAPSSGNWPQKVDLATNEGRSITLRDGTTRTLTLQSYNIVIPRHKVQATVSVSGAGKIETHTLEVGFGADAVSINGLRIYAYTWKGADSYGNPQPPCTTAFESVSRQDCFPLTLGKDIGFAVSDAKYTMYPDISKYTYPVDLAFHEGIYLQTFLDPDGTVAHSGYDIGTPFGTDLLAIKDGYLWIQGATVWITDTIGSQWDSSKPCWVFTHSGVKLVGEGFVTKGTRIVSDTADGDNNITANPAAAVDHYHMGSCGSFDFGSWYFMTQVWNYEHQNNFPSPRYWLALGPFSGDINTNNISIPANPKEGDVFNSKSWKFADNLVNSVTRMGELLSDAPFSGHSTRDTVNSTGYAASYIYSPSQTQATLKFGATRGAKIWMNGQLLDTITGARYDSFNVSSQSPVEIDRYQYPITLNAGWNTLITKTDLGSRQSSDRIVPMLFSIKLGDANGNRIPGLIFSTRDINLQTTNVGNTSIGLNWSNPNYQGTFVSSYKVDIATDAAFSNIVKTDTVSGSSLSHTVTGLLAGTQYHIRVRPYNDYEMGGSTYWQHYDAVVVTTGGASVPTPTPTSTLPLPSQNPPAGLTPQQIPLFVVFGSDDNNIDNGGTAADSGVKFLSELMASRTNSDGSRWRMTFYIMGGSSYDVSWEQTLWHQVARNGNEIGNHQWGPTFPGSYANWLTEWTNTDNVIRQLLVGAGLNPDDSRSFNRRGVRTHQDQMDQAAITSAIDLGYLYHSSHRTGHPDTNGGIAWFPGSMEIPWPGAAFWDTTNYQPASGMMQIPQHYVGGNYCDTEAIPSNPTPADSDAYANNAIAALQKSLSGNRAPVHFCLHDFKYNANRPTNRSAIVKIADWISQQQTAGVPIKVVTNGEVYDWMKNPVALGTQSAPTPTPTTVVQKVTAPAISPNGGTFAGSVSVTLSTTTTGATIRYTTDGTAPTATSTLYIGAFTLSNSATIQTKAFRAGYTDSDAASAVFTITAPPTASVTLTVDASKTIYPFKSTMRGVATGDDPWYWKGLWEHPGSCCPVGKRDAIIQAAKLLRPGVIRYAGGLSANNTGWWRNYTSTNDPAWTYTDLETGKTYSYGHSYIPPQVDSVADFARQIGAEVMVQMNACDNNPKMWADMARYTNIEKGYKFKYWEFGNEQSLEDEWMCLGTATEEEASKEFANRYVVYRNALLAVDPTIKVMASPIHQPYQYNFDVWETDVFSAAARSGRGLDVMTWHSYPLVSGSGVQAESMASLLAFDGSVSGACVDPWGCSDGTSGIAPGNLNYWLHRRGIPEQLMPYIKANFQRTNPAMETAITEFGPHASAHLHPFNSSHPAALWLADMLGRYAYNGLDIMTYFTLESGGLTAGTNTRGLMGIWNSDTIDIRPIYSTMYLYAQYFGDMMVQSATSDPMRKVVIWASTDSKDPGKLKLMLVNLTDKATSSAISINNFSAMNGSAYEMTSDAPVSLADPDSFAGNHTFINGVRIPDVQRTSPAVFTATLTGIAPKPVTSIARTGANSTVNYALPAYSAVSMVLNNAGTPVPTPVAPTPVIPTPTPVIPVVPTPVQPTPISVPTPTSSPSPVINVPGRIEAEDYKLGGEGVGYHDTTPGNTGLQYGAGYRNDGVDIEETTDVGGGYNVGWTINGEWLAYNINVQNAGTYSVTARVAFAPAGTKTLHIEVDGVDVTGPMNIQSTGDWQSWRNTAANVALTPGAHQLKVVFDSDVINLNYLDIATISIIPAPTPVAGPLTISSVDKVYAYADKSSDLMRITGTSFSINADYRIRFLQGGIEKASFTVQPKDTTTIEINLTPVQIGALLPGQYILEIVRVSDSAAVTLSQQLLITRLGDVWSSSGTRDGRVDIFDVSRFLSKWKSTLASDIAELDINPGPANVSLGKIDIYDINKMMSNWTR